MTRPDEPETSREPESLLLLDACCVINLLASGEAEAVLAALDGFEVAVARLVEEREVVKIPAARDEDRVDESQEADRGETALTLEPLVEKGLVRVLTPETEEEQATFVDLALHLDDGEAMPGALAIHRGGSVATDDRKAIRVLGEQSPAPEIMRTSWLLRTWAESQGVARDRLRTALANIETRASFFPPADDPHREWWHRIVAETKA